MRLRAAVFGNVRAVTQLDARFEALDELVVHLNIGESRGGDDTNSR